MYPIDAGVDAVIDDDAEVLIVSPPRTTEEKVPDADPVPVRPNEVVPLFEAENPRTEAERQAPVTKIPSGDSVRQVCSALYHIILFPSANDYVDSSPNHIDDG